MCTHKLPPSYSLLTIDKDAQKQGSVPFFIADFFATTARVRRLWTSVASSTLRVTFKKSIR
jgi:hypothetical protein